jgi:hypothetical protein
MPNPTFVKKLVVAAVVMGTLAAAPAGVAGAATQGSGPKPTGGPHRTAIQKAQLYLSCPLFQARANRLQRIKIGFNQAISELNAAEAKAVADHDTALAGSLTRAIAAKRHDKAYLVAYTRRGYHKRMKYEEYVLRLHRHGKAHHRSLTASRCHLTKLTVPRVTAAPLAAPAATPSTTSPSTTSTPSTTSPSTTSTSPIPSTPATSAPSPSTSTTPSTLPPATHS